jgi:hypothetical protein
MTFLRHLTRAHGLPPGGLRSFAQSGTFRPIHTFGKLFCNHLRIHCTFLSCRILLDGYVRFIQSFNAHINELEDVDNGHEVEEFDIYEEARVAFTDPAKAYIMAGLREWAAEGIRSALRITAISAIYLIVMKEFTVSEKLYLMRHNFRKKICRTGSPMRNWSINTVTGVGLGKY